jgi:protein-tyrosine phosphatase
VIDLHCHILPGIDDGPPTIEDTLALVGAAAATGATTMIATPHVSPRYRNDSGVIASGVDLVRARLLAAGIAVDVRPGAEIAIPRLADLSNAELGRLTLGDGGWLLIESPFKTPVDEVPAALAALRNTGHRIVLAHPERCPGFHSRPDVLEALIRDDEVLASVTAGSLVGQFGREVQRFVLWMASAGLIHNVASDAHDCVRRPPGIAHAMRQSGLGAHVELLTEILPAAILSDGPLPELPSSLLAGRATREPWQPAEPAKPAGRDGPQTRLS